jgi:hypothetical protein
MQKRKTLKTRFCHCIKSVRKTVRVRPGPHSIRRTERQQKEQAAIGICVRSVLQTRGKTLKKFRCGTKPSLQTQPILKNK